MHFNEILRCGECNIGDFRYEECKKDDTRAYTYNPRTGKFYVSLPEIVNKAVPMSTGIPESQKIELMR